MKARKNPTNEQLLRRLRRPLDSERDPRIKNDSYYALRFQGFPHSYAKRAFRDQPPVIHEIIVSDDSGEYALDPDEVLFPAGSVFPQVEVATRPKLSDQIILSLKPRDSEYTAYDDQIRSFGVRVRTSGHKSFIVYYRVRQEKKLRKYTIGPTSEFSLEEARGVARDCRRLARSGNVPIK